MAKGKERQALAISDAAQRAANVGVPFILDRANSALQAEAARIFAESEAKRMNGGGSVHVILNGNVSGFLKDSKTLLQFADGKASLTMHD